jgi:hypothetical protein
MKQNSSCRVQHDTRKCRKEQGRKPDENITHYIHGAHATKWMNLSVEKMDDVTLILLQVSASKFLPQ